MAAESVPMVTGINWFLREDFSRILEIMEDRELIAADYDTWLEAAENGIRKLAKDGIRAIKVEIRPEPFLAYCRARSLKINAKARNEYAGSILQERYRNGTL